MESLLNVKLIDGVYTRKEAKNILKDIFKIKIQFNKLKNLISIEREKQVDLETFDRVKELERDLQKLILFIDKSEEGEFSIHSEIQIKSNK